MNKSLEALEGLKNTLLAEGYYQDMLQDVSIIEKDLQTLEIIKEMLDSDLTEKLNANSRKILKDIFDNLPKEKQDLLKEVML